MVVLNLILTTNKVATKLRSRFKSLKILPHLYPKMKMGVKKIFRMRMLIMRIYCKLVMYLLMEQLMDQMEAKTTCHLSQKTLTLTSKIRRFQQLLQRSSQAFVEVSVQEISFPASRRLLLMDLIMVVWKDQLDQWQKLKRKELIMEIQLWSRQQLWFNHVFGGN